MPGNTLKTFLENTPQHGCQRWLSLESRKLTLLACLWAASCSLRDFDYLQQGTGDSSGGSGGSSAGGSGGSSAGSSANTGGSGGSSTGGSGGSGGASVGGASTSDTSTSSGGSTSNNNATTSNTSGGGSTSSSTVSTTGEGGMGAGGEGGAPPVYDPGVLVNGSFEDLWTGWTVEGTGIQGTQARVKWPASGATTPDGFTDRFIVDVWHDGAAYDLAVVQILDDLEDGLYTFKGFFKWGIAQTQPKIFARNCGGTDLMMNVPATGDNNWVEVGIGGIEVIGGHCEVGFSVVFQPNDWLNADQFSMTMDPQ